MILVGPSNTGYPVWSTDSSGWQHPVLWQCTARAALSSHGIGSNVPLALLVDK